MDKITDTIKFNTSKIVGYLKRYDKNQWTVIIVFGFCILCLIIFFINSYHRPVESIVTVIDTGEAQSIVFQNDGNVTLYDAGCDEEHSSAIDDFMRTNQLGKINTLILSNNEKENINQAQHLLERYKVGHVYMSGFGNGTKKYHDLIDYLEENKTLVTNPVFGDKITVGEAQIEFIHPNKTYNTRNDASLAIRYSDDYHFALIASGDASSYVEKDMIKAYDFKKYTEIGDDTTSTYLIAGKRGSRESTSELWLDTIQPETVIIPSGDKPSKELTERLVQRNINYLSTENDGSIQIRSGEDGIALSTLIIPTIYEEPKTDEEAINLAKEVRENAIKEAKYVGNRNTMHYFDNDNPKVKNITDSNITYFNSKETAEAEGFTYSK